MAIHWKAHWGTFFLLIPLAGGSAWAATAASPLTAGAATRSASRASQVLPAALQPALYRALAKDAGVAHGINKDGCAVLQKQKLKACFDAHGAHFTGATPVSIHLVAFGRSGTLSSVGTVPPTIRSNRVNYAHGNLTAWWRILPMGFEQGFTIAKRPNGHGELTLALAIQQNAGTPLTRNSRESRNPAGEGSETNSRKPVASTGMTNGENGNTIEWGRLRYGRLVVTDANGKSVPAQLTRAGNRILIAVNDARATYPIIVDPLVWIEQKVTASDGAADDSFGWSVAVSGTVALIGAPFVTVQGNANQGAAYVFTESNGKWSEKAKLTQNDGASGDEFGEWVALSGTTALIGAPFANGIGAAYVFGGSNGTWTQLQKLTASDGALGDHFGWTVALDGSSALIGSPFATIENNNSQGAAYVFDKAAGTWSQAAKLTASDGTSDDEFGWSVAIDGATALVSAYGANGYTGAAYVFSQSGGAWTQVQKLTASNGATFDEFGWRVALGGQTALITAPFASGGAGAVYVFGGSNGAWAQLQELTADDGFSGADFGSSVALAGPVAFVGAMYGDDAIGEAYIFVESNGTWVQTVNLTEPNGVAYDAFGLSVALAGTTGLIGADGAIVNGNSFQGAAYFEGQSDLGLAVSAPQTIGEGQEYTSQTIATNSSSAASPAVSATITVPAAASFVSANATQGSCSEAADVVTCDFGQISGNAGTATANVTLKAIGSSGTTIENTASIAKATPALTASAPTEITSPGSCPAGYTEFFGHLDAGQSFTSDPITVMEAGQKYADLTSPASFAFFTITDTRYGQHTYVYPHAKQGHRWGAAGSYQVGVQAGPTVGGDYTLCVNLNPAQ